MKLKHILAIGALAVSLGFTSCSNEDGNQASKPGFLQEKDSISQKPAMGDTTLNPTGN